MTREEKMHCIIDGLAEIGVIVIDDAGTATEAEIAVLIETIKQEARDCNNKMMQRPASSLDEAFIVRNAVKSHLKGKYLQNQALKC